MTIKKMTLLVFTCLIIFFFAGCQFDFNDDIDQNPIHEDFILLDQALKALQSSERYEVVFRQTINEELLLSLRYVYTNDAIHVLENNTFLKPFYIVFDEVIHYCFDKTGLENYVCQNEPIINYEHYSLNALFNMLTLEMFENVERDYILKTIPENLPLLGLKDNELTSFTISINPNIDINYVFTDEDDNINNILLNIRKINEVSILLPNFFNQLQLETLIEPILATNTYTVSYRRNGVDHLGQFTDVQFIKFDANYYYVWRQFKGPAIETYYIQVADIWQECLKVKDVGWRCNPSLSNNPYKNHINQYNLEQFDLSWFNPYGKTFVLDEQYFDEMKLLIGHLVPNLSIDAVIIRQTTLGTEIHFKFINSQNNNVFENILITIYDLNKTVIELPFDINS